jgi:prevent-host-death family protein
MTIAAGAFKANCLSIMEKVRTTRSPVTITKRGKPIAVLTPYPEASPRPLFGRMKGLARLADDLTAPTGASWEAEQ